VLEAATNLFTAKYWHCELAWMDLRCVQRWSLVNTTINVMFMLETGNFLSTVSSITFFSENSVLELANPELIH